MLKRLLILATLAGGSACLFAQKPAWQPASGHLTLPLWPGEAPGASPNPAPEIDTTTEKDNLIAGKPLIRLGNVSSPTLTLYTPKEKNTGAAVVVFPGGGYHILAIDLEGSEVCDWLTTVGISCVLVKYRVPNTGPYPKSSAALQDAQRALGIVRSRATEWHIDPQRIGVLGFSAGAHLAAALSTHFDHRLYVHIDASDDLTCRPDFAVIVYPGYLALADENFAPNPEIRVTDQTPPSFIVQAEDDPVHVENAVVYFLALKNERVPAELHIYADGGHGYGLRPTALPVTTWPLSVEAWLHTIHILAGPGGSGASTQNQADEWWKHAVIYEIYPRSFQDSDGNGVGDIKGITSRLDYIKDLGIDAIWITPMYPSPGVDYGYDISDYTAIDPEYGTMADFDHLVAEARKRNIRVIMDYVINHTSDQNAWFKESRSSRTNPKRDWYIWRDGKAPGQPPNNWQSWFGHSAWTLDPQTNQYYYHYFYKQQPDLNWRNPEVKKAMEGVLEFWMKKGVAGFRIDAVSRLFEDPDLHDDPYLPGFNAYGDRNIEHKYTDNYPEVHDVLKELRRVVDQYPGDPVLITEADEPNVEELTKLYGHGDEVQLPMDFQIADVNKLSAPAFRRLFNDIENNSAHGQPEYFFSNHDQPRQWDRYGDGVHNDQIAKLMAVLLLTTRGTPQMYYGEELGMRTTDPARIEDVHDPIGKLGWPKEKGRDGERTPMQWNSSAHAGFTASASPWLPVPPSASRYNVETEEKDPDSILNAYKKLLALRKSEPALRDGSYQAVNEHDPDVFAYMRESGASRVLVALNMSSLPKTVALHLGGKGVSTAAPLFSSPSQSGVLQLDHLELPAFGALVASVK